MDEKKAKLMRLAKNVGFVVILVVVIILIARSGNKKAEAPSEAVSTEQTQTALKVTEPVDVAGNVYDFTGVRFEFDTTDPSVPQGQTWVKMWLADFTRNGSAIMFGKPYKLGFHAGVCTEVPTLDIANETGIPFGYVQCVSEGMTRDIAVFQENQNVVVKFRDVVNGTAGAFQDLYAVDVTTIVRSSNGATIETPAQTEEATDSEDKTTSVDSKEVVVAEEETTTETEEA